MPTIALTGSGNWIAPAGITGTLRVQCWGGNASGGGTGAVIGWNGGGGGSGEYAEEATLAVTPGQSFAYAQGAGGIAANNAAGHDGADTSFGTVVAHGGKGGKTQQSSNAAGGLPGTGSVNSIHHDGGTGGAGTVSANSGGGAGGAGTGANGSSGAGITGGGAVTGGAAGPNGVNNGPGVAGTAPNGTSTGGSAGSGAYSNTAAARSSGAGGAGQILVTYSTSSVPVPYEAGSAGVSAAGATAVTITHATAAGDAIVVAASTTPSAAQQPQGVSDSQGNSYTPAGQAGNLSAWVADGPIPLHDSGQVRKFSWLANGDNVHTWFGSDPTRVQTFFNNTSGYLIGSDPTTNPVQDALAANPVLKYTCYLQFLADVTGIAQTSAGVTYSPRTIIAAFKWVMYDNESWADTPLNEAQDPWTYMQLFGQLAHQHGYKVMLVPARDLGAVSGTVRPKLPGETLNAWFIRTGLATTAATYGDVFSLQDQANTILDLPAYTTFTSFFNQAYAQAKAANPLIPVWCGLSTNYGTAQQEYNAAVAVPNADGFWYNIIGDIATTDAFFGLALSLPSVPDVVTVQWSGTGSQGHDVIVTGVPGAALSSILDPATQGATGAGTAVSVTSNGTLQNTAEIALLLINDGSVGGTPSALGSFTSIRTVQAGAVQFLTAAYQQLASAAQLTGSATITGSATSWGALLVLLSSTSVSGGTGAVIGATISAGSYGGTIDQDISAWVNSVINPGRTLDSERVFFGPGVFPASMSSAGLTRHAGVRRVLMSFKPSVTPSASDLAALDAFLASCKTGGLDAKVALYHEPDSAAGLTATQYKAVIQYYGPVVRKYYPLVYCKAAYRTHVDPGSPAAFYPGDAWVDELAYDFYEYDYRLYGVTPDSMAAVADGASPPKPFGFWELGVVTGGVAGTTAGSPGACTQAQGTAYMAYVKSWLSQRNTAGKPIGDVSYYDYVNAAKNWDHVIQPGSYLVALYDAIYDALSSQHGAPAVFTFAPAGLAAAAGIAPQPLVNVSGNVPTGGGGGSTPPPDVSPRRDYHWLAGPKDGSAFTELQTLAGRTVTWRLTDAHEAQFTVSASGGNDNGLAELATELLIVRAGQPVYRGRLGASADDMQATLHLATFQALSVRGVLQHRMLYDGDLLTWDATDVAAIALQLIQQTQRRAGGDLGIVRGLGFPAGVTKTKQCAPGDIITDKIDDLAYVDVGGFDWDITPTNGPDLHLDVWPGGRGRDLGLVLQRGDQFTLPSWARSVSVDQYADALIMSSTGNTPPPPVQVEIPNLATAPQGRWDASLSAEENDAATLTARAGLAVGSASVLTPTYTIPLRPGYWLGPAHIWLGDVVTVIPGSGRLTAPERLRVSEVSVQVDDTEQVTLTAGAPEMLHLGKRLKQLANEIRRLRHHQWRGRLPWEPA